MTDAALYGLAYYTAVIAGLGFLAGAAATYFVIN